MMTKCCSQCRFFTLFELYYFLCKESVLPLLSMQEMFQTRDLILRPWLLLFLFRHEKIKTSKGFLFFRVSTPSSFSEHIISNSRFVVKPSAVQSIPWLRCISSSFWKKEPLLFEGCLPYVTDDREYEIRKTMIPPTPWVSRTCPWLELIRKQRRRQSNETTSFRKSDLQTSLRQYTSESERVLATTASCQGMRQLPIDNLVWLPRKKSEIDRLKSDWEWKRLAKLSCKEYMSNTLCDSIDKSLSLAEVFCVCNKVSSLGHHDE